MKDDRMSILIMSCDKNVDVLQYCTVLFEKYWGDCSFPVYIVSESKTVESRYKSILCGKESTWTKEVLYAIEKVPGEYVLILMDDGFLHSNVQNDEIVKIVDFVYENEIKYYRIPRMKNNYRKEADYPGKNDVSMIYDNKAYGVTMGIVIWQKEEFKRIFGDGNKTAWEIENHFSKQARHGSGHFIMGYVTDKRLLIPIAHMITKGKWIPSSIEVLEKQGFHIDTQQRGILSQKQVFQMTLRSIGTKICPTYLRHPIKKLLMMCGIKFVTEY